jgi:hypothetical protein
VGLLDNFEKGLERAVNGAFAKTFKSGLQPVEITAALKRELETNAAVVSRDRILVPNNFTVNLASADYQRMLQLGPALIDQLIQLVQQHATRQGFQFAGGITLVLVENPRMSDGMVQITSSTVQGAVSWTPVLDIGGKRYPITRSRTVIGRGSDADITVDDTGISRQHVEVLWDGSRAQARDLGSTNGSTLNGARLTKAPFEPESVLQIGRTQIIFRVLAQAAANSDQYADLRQGRGSHPAPSARPAQQQRPAAVNQRDLPSTDTGNANRQDPGGFWGKQ